eukprot:6344924-Heterocapsa_arctica.AAC.1
MYQDGGRACASVRMQKSIIVEAGGRFPIGAGFMSVVLEKACCNKTALLFEEHTALERSSPESSTDAPTRTRTASNKY